MDGPARSGVNPVSMRLAWRGVHLGCVSGLRRCLATRMWVHLFLWVLVTALAPGMIDDAHVATGMHCWPTSQRRTGCMDAIHNRLAWWPDGFAPNPLWVHPFIAGLF